MNQDVSTWARSAGLGQDVAKTLQAQGFTSTAALAQLTPDDITDFFQTPGVLNVMQCVQLKRALTSLATPSAAAHAPPTNRGQGVGHMSGYAQSADHAHSAYNSNAKGAGHSDLNGSHASMNFQKADTYRFLLLGKTGSGKSTTGNTIFGRELFSTAPTFSSVTSVCERKTGKRGNVNIEIMDSPGLYDTHSTQEEIGITIVQAVAGMHPGPHAVLYVVRMGRYTAEEYGAYKRLKALFDPDICRYMVVLFTGGDMLDGQGVTVEDMLRNNSPKELQEVLRECGNRYVVFNNMARNKDTQVAALFAKVRDMKASHGGQPYTCPKYDAVGTSLEEEVDRRIQEVEKKDLERQKYVQELHRQTEAAQVTVEQTKKKFQQKEVERAKKAKEDEEKRQLWEAQMKQQMQQQQQQMEEYQAERGRLDREREEHAKMMRDQMEHMNQQQQQRAREDAERQERMLREVGERMEQHQRQMEMEGLREQLQREQKEKEQMQMQMEMERQRRDDRESLERAERKREEKEERERRERERDEEKRAKQRDKEMETMKQGVVDRKEEGFLGKAVGFVKNAAKKVAGWFGF